MLDSNPGHLDKPLMNMMFWVVGAMRICKHVTSVWKYDVSPISESGVPHPSENNCVTLFFKFPANQQQYSPISPTGITGYRKQKTYQNAAQIKIATTNHKNPLRDDVVVVVLGCGAVWTRS